MQEKLKRVNFISLCGQSFFPQPVSGGDTLNFELLKKINKHFSTSLIINDATEDYAKQNLDCKIYPIKDIFNFNVKVRKWKFLIPLAFINSTFRIIIILNKIIHSINNNAVVLYSSGDFFCNILPMFLCKKINKKIKTVVSVHHLNAKPNERKENSFCVALFSYVFQRFSLYILKNNADIVFLLNSEVKDELVKLGFKKENLFVIGAGINFREIKTNKNLQASEGEIVYFARLSKMKGIFDLPLIFSEVFKKNPKARLLLIGTGDEKDINELKNTLKLKSIFEKTIFKGFVEDKQKVYDIMQAGKVFVLPSYEEGWGITLFEAIECGLAPVVYDLPVFKEIFGKEIISVVKGDTLAFAGEVVGLLSNEQKRKAYNASLRKIISPYGLDNVLEMQIGLIEKVVEK